MKNAKQTHKQHAYAIGLGKESELRIKMLDEGNGMLEGIGSVFGDLDDVGDIVIKGAFSDTLQDFSDRGFLANSHDWHVDGMIGYPVKAIESDVGLEFAAEFHSTADAQIVRTKAIERLKAGKVVSLSIGFYMDEWETILPKDYKKRLPEFVPAEKLEATLAKAAAFPMVTIIKRVTLAEISIVPRPALSTAMATVVKSQQKAMGELQQKGLLSTWTSTRATLRAVSTVWEAVWDVLYDTVVESGVPKADKLGRSAELFDEGRDVTLRYLDALLDEDGESIQAKAAHLRDVFTKVLHVLPEGTPYTEQLEALLADADAALARGKAIHDVRKKEGRELSTANRNRLEAIATSLEALAKDAQAQAKEIKEWLSASSKSNDTPETPTPTQVKEGEESSMSADEPVLTQKDSEEEPTTTEGEATEEQPTEGETASSPPKGAVSEEGSTTEETPAVSEGEETTKGAGDDLALEALRRKFRLRQLQN